MERPAPHPAAERRAPRLPRLCSTRPSAIATRSTPGSSAPGTCASSVAVITLWPPARRTSTSRPGARRRARSSRRRAAAGAARRARRPAPRARRAAARGGRGGLAARPVGAQLAAVAAEREVVAVGPVPGEPALEVAVDPLGELGGQLVGGLRTGAGRYASSTSPSSPSAAAWPRTAPGAARRPPAVTHQRDAVARKRRVPGRERAAPRTASPHGGDQRVALRERRRVLAARGGARRPQRGDDLVEVRPAQGRCAEHQVEPVGQEHGHQRAGVGSRSAARRARRRRAGASPRRAGSRRHRVRAATVLGAPARAGSAPRRTARPRARWPSGTTGRWPRSTAPPAGSSSPRRCGPRSPSAPAPSRSSAAS